jgi:hypothetical protein
MDTERLTYAMYAANPAIRDAIELEVRRARAGAMSRYLITPLAEFFAHMFKRAHTGFARSPQMSA